MTARQSIGFGVGDAGNTTRGALTVRTKTGTVAATRCGGWISMARQRISNGMSNAPERTSVHAVI